MFNKFSVINDIFICILSLNESPFSSMFDIPIETPDLVEVQESELYGGKETERAAGGFGSTGTK